MVTRILCRSAVLSCLLIDSIETHTRYGRAISGSVAYADVSNWNPDRAAANYGAANISVAASIDAIDIHSREFNKTAGAIFVINNSRGATRKLRGGGITNNDLRLQTCVAVPDSYAGSCITAPQPRGFFGSLRAVRQS
jgi:hypothetical protein